jgi:uncharacterized phage protein gp47/JayE
MALRVPNLEEVHGFLVALFKSLFPDADVARESFNWKWVRVLSGAVTDAHALIRSVLADLLPDTAEGEALDRWGRIRGVLRKPATAARRARSLRVFGTLQATVTAGAELVHVSGLRYAVPRADVVGAAGYVDVDLAAIDTGRRTRLSRGESLTFLTPLPGVAEQAELQLDLSEDGDDAESDGAYRLRILSRFATPPLGGAPHDYVQWALEVPGVAAAFAYPNRRGLGSVDLAALHAGSGTARLLTAGENDELLARVSARRPVGAELRVLTVVPQTVDIEVGILPTGEAQYAFDWDDRTPPVVQSWDAASRRLTFSIARPETMKAGDRLALSLALGGTGEQFVIERLDGTNAVILEKDPPSEPMVGNPVFAGGPLVDPVRAALFALCDRLGTANPDAKRYGAWEGTLRIAALYRAVNSVPGVLDSWTVTPIGNVDGDDPAFPNDGTIGVVVAGRVLVRRLHP